MDIDKLFLSGLNYKTEGVENTYGYVEQHLVKESELTEEHQLQNKIIDMYLALLIDKKDNGGPRNVQILHRSIDNDTDLAKSVLKDIEGSGKSKTETPYSFYSLARQTASKNDYITGKVGIGPFALNNNNQILTMIYHISFRESQSSLLSTLGLSRLDKQLDVDGNSIMSWISAMINAHVDIAKDPWISRLNVNPFSYNITNLLLRTGWGGNTFYFLTQPIMKQMADAYVKASSQYMQQNGSTYSRQQQSIKDVAEQYFGKDVTFDGNTLDDALSLIDAGDKESIQAINKAIKKLLESEQFKQDARDYAQGNDVADQKGLKSRQLGIYLAYVQFSKYANALANLVKYCKIDTKKHGKSAAEQLVYKEGFDELFEFATDEDGVLIKKGDVGALFEPAGLLNLVEHSYVGTKTRNAISLTKVILGGQFMSSTTGFIQMLRQLNTMAGNTSLSVSFVQSAQKALSAAIKSEFFNDYASRISDNPRYMHDLVNSSSEDLEFSYDASTNSMSITGNKHSLKSYVGQPILLWYKDKDGNLQQYIPRDKNGNALPLKVLTAKDDKIQLNISINGNFNGMCRLLGGANTIFDRLSRLKPMIYHNNDYSDLQGNLLLEMLIPGKRVEYSPKDAVLGERPDTYDDLKFVKLQNFVDDGGINTNYIINAWNELLEYQNDKQPQVAEYIRDFARDLIVYAFITSGDTQGFTKMFKYVPASWRKKSGYADFINRKLVQLNSIPTIDLNDVLLNNWYDNKLVPTYQFYSKDANGKRSSNFIGVAKMKIINGNKQTQSAYPTILAALKKNDEGVYEPSIAVESSPKFIKIPRSYNHYDSQRQYNVYQLYGFARHDSGIMYPVYVLVQPKGTKVSGGFMVTEYGRDDSTPSSTEYVVNQGALRDFVESADFINQLPAIKKNFGDEYAAILNDLRTEQTGGVAAAITDDDQAQTQTSMSVTSSTAQADYRPVNIYFKSEENAELSNFARRPFSFTPKDFYFGDDASEHQFYSVEQAFQYYKIMVLESIANSLNYSLYTGAQEDAREGKSVNRDILLKRAQEILNTSSAEVARGLGKKSLGLQDIFSQFGLISSAKEIEESIFKVWDERSSKIMKALIKASFEQNPQATQRLLDTGNATLTHTQDKSKWKTEFPRLLMEVRDELRKSQGTTQSQASTPTRTDSSEKSVTEQLVQHLKDSGFTVYDINGNVDENNFKTEGVQFFWKKHYLNNTYKSKLNSFKQAILSNKYTQAGVDFLKVDDLYILFKHASHSETIDSIEKGSAGFGLIDVFDSEDNIDYAEISRLMSINYQHTHDEQYILNSIKRAGIRITDNIRNQVNSAFYKSSVQFAIEHIFKDSKGVVYGYVDNHGNIYFDKNKIRPEHPIHEYTHIWDRVVALKNPSLWIRGVELMKQFNGGKLWNEIANSEFYGKKWSNMSDAQREFMIASEVHARLVGEGGAKLISEIEAKQGSSDIISKLKDWILKFWQSLKQTFSNWSKEDIEALTLKDFNHMTLRDFVTSNTEVINGVDARSSISDKIEMVGLANYSSGIEVSEDAQRAIDRIKAISPDEQQYITPVITGESYIPGVSLIDAINIAANITSIERRRNVSDKIVHEKISQVIYPLEQKALFDLLSFGTVPNNTLLILADYIDRDDIRALVAQYICHYLRDHCQKKSFYDVVVPIIKSIDVKYDDSRQQSQFNDDIMKHCKGN